MLSIFSVGFLNTLKVVNAVTMCVSCLVLTKNKKTKYSKLMFAEIFACYDDACGQLSRN